MDVKAEMCRLLAIKNIQELADFYADIATEYDTDEEACIGTACSVEVLVNYVDKNAKILDALLPVKSQT